MERSAPEAGSAHSLADALGFMAGTVDAHRSAGPSGRRQLVASLESAVSTLASLHSQATGRRLGGDEQRAAKAKLGANCRAAMAKAVGLVAAVGLDPDAVWRQHAPAAASDQFESDPAAAFAEEARLSFGGRWSAGEPFGELRRRVAGLAAAVDGYEAGTGPGGAVGREAAAVLASLFLLLDANRRG